MLCRVRLVLITGREQVRRARPIRQDASFLVIYEVPCVHTVHAAAN